MNRTVTMPHVDSSVPLTLRELGVRLSALQPRIVGDANLAVSSAFLDSMSAFSSSLPR